MEMPNQEIQDKLVSMASQGNPGDLTRLMEQVAAQETRNKESQAVQDFRNKPAGEGTIIPLTGNQRAAWNDYLNKPSGTIQPDGIPPSASTAISTPALSYQKFAEERSKLSSIENIEERGIKASELIGSVQAHVSKTYADTAKTAEAMYGIPELEKALNARILADKKDILYWKYLSDSPITAKIRNDLEQARSLAVGKSKDLINQNPELARLESEAKMLGESEIRLMSLMENRSYKAENKAMQEIAKAGSNGTKIAATLDPALDTEEKQATWFNNRVKQDPDLGVLATNMNSSEGMLDSVIYTKSGAVTDVVSSLHAQAKAPNNPALQEAEMVGNITSWDAASLDKLQKSPTLSPAIEAMSKTGLSPSLENLVATIYRTPDMATRMKLVAELRGYANEAVTYNNKGIYGQISPTALDAVINRSQLAAIGGGHSSAIYGEMASPGLVGIGE